MRVVVVGAGLAGAKAVEELRDLGHHDEVVVVGAERHRPYERPPLSKGILLGSDDEEEPFIHDAGWYADHGVQLLTGEPATSLDLRGHSLSVGDREVGWDRLLLAAGAQPRQLATLEESGADVR